MTFDSANSSDLALPPVRLIRGLEQRYRFVIALVVAILLLDQVVLQPMLVELNGLAPAINLAGRQRMLSQRITKAALALERESNPAARVGYRTELTEALADWCRVHRGLLEGDTELHLDPAASTVIVAALSDLQPAFETLLTAANRLTRADVTIDSDELVTILSVEQDYLLRMDNIVALYECEAQQQVGRLRWMAIGAMTLVVLLLAGLGRVVLCPAIDLIRRQMEALITAGDNLRAARDQLEDRVHERTIELTDANRALEAEIHERELAEERSRILQRQLAHASRVTSLGQLATGLAHEINQPLTAIANYAETADIALSRGDDDAGTQECVRRIREAALRAGKIVRRMRNFVRSSESPRTSVSMRMLIDDILQLCAFELQRAHVRLALEWHEDVEDLASADAIQIQQVLVNLVQNAIQAMHSTPLDQRILTVRLERVDMELQIDVEDSGCGFDPVSVDGISSPFVTTKPEGLGMGLAISRSIIAAHGGKLWAANRESGGACVSFTLPSLPPQDDRVADTADSLCRG